MRVVDAVRRVGDALDVERRRVPCVVNGGLNANAARSTPGSARTFATTRSKNATRLTGSAYFGVGSIVSHRQQPLGPEADFDRAEVGQRADHQPGCREQHDGRANLERRPARRASIGCRRRPPTAPDECSASASELRPACSAGARLKIKPVAMAEREHERDHTDVDRRSVRCREAGRRQARQQLAADRHERESQQRRRQSRASSPRRSADESAGRGWRPARRAPRASPRRPAARDSSKLARLAHAINSTATAAAISTINSSADVAEHVLLHRSGHDRRAQAGGIQLRASAASTDCMSSRIASRDTPGLRRPTTFR